MGLLGIYLLGLNNSSAPLTPLRLSGSHRLGAGVGTPTGVAAPAVGVGAVVEGVVAEDPVVEGEGGVEAAAAAGV